MEEGYIHVTGQRIGKQNKKNKKDLNWCGGHNRDRQRQTESTNAISLGFKVVFILGLCSRVDGLMDTITLALGLHPRYRHLVFGRDS